MSIAWSGLVLLILLLPGVVFFLGLYLPERFSRDTIERSAIGQLAGVLSVAFFVHGAAFGAVSLACRYTAVPCIDLAVFFDTLGIGERAQDATLVAQSIRQFWWEIYLYVIITFGVGLLLGWCVGLNIVSGGRLSVLARHTWVYRLTQQKAGSYPLAFVMTRIQQDERVLLYRGFLTAFGLATDGCISYVVLGEPTRLYMYLEAEAARTTPIPNYHRIGASRVAAGDTGRTENAILVIHGDEIANVVVEPYEFTHQPASLAELARMIERVSRELAEKNPPSVTVPRGRG